MDHPRSQAQAHGLRQKPPKVMLLMGSGPSDLAHCGALWDGIPGPHIEHISDMEAKAQSFHCPCETNISNNDSSYPGGKGRGDHFSS
jgi:hypothetical protein